MRGFIAALAVIVALVLAGITGLARLPDGLPLLAPRAGPPLASVKTWGYQLQSLNAKLIPDDIDLLVVDYSRDGTQERALTAPDVEALRHRAGGRLRVVLCYVSIGEAENYRAYWQRTWAASPPPWLGPENPSWKGNFAVQYWHPEWQRNILDRAHLTPSLMGRIWRALFPKPQPYLDQIIEAGFDGVYLDRVDAYEKALETRPAAKADMIAFVAAISGYARARRGGFLVVPQNGEALLADPQYRELIDGVGKEDLFYGETGDAIANNPADARHAITLLNRAKAEGRPVFAIEYLANPDLQRGVAQEWHQLGYVGVFAERGLSLPPAVPLIPAPARAQP